MKSSPTRIVILTASYGEGHVQTSRALRQSFGKAGIEQVKIIDLMKEAHPLLNKISTKLYMKSTAASQFGFDYYGWSYYITRHAKPNNVWNRFYNRLGIKRLKQLIQQEQPDAVISTFPFGAAPLLCKSLNIPSFTVITDFSLHSRWLHPDIDKYYVATEELKTEMVTCGIAAQRIQVSGIPLREQFGRHALEDAPNKLSESFHKLDPDRKTVLLMAGAYGLKVINKMIRSLLSMQECQLVVVCGKNEKLERRLKTKYANEPFLRIFGFVDNIHELMLISSCMITKAGGITLSEALVLQVPCFIFKPFAGQEKENALYLAKKRIAAISNSTDELAVQLRHFFSKEKFASQIKQRIELIQKESAADFIVKDLIHTIRQLAHL
ncbi:MGDG synthase family glycosyltransferase [Paenibacillus agricola]|uniref:Glycosyltransferase n=1 Tax=Paenibacillus agricola TaxID=2716264 RepID=A0ABX0JI15_9BACL|nr:glycosyltransferase [Paenibacillus agricola]NHN34044.1 glycosyltransferase [Paenibacillus agricola]